MSHKHDHSDECDCEHHELGEDSRMKSKPCHVEMMVDNLLKSLNLSEDNKEE